MTSGAIVCAVVAGIAALANWWSRLAGSRPVEVWSKPLALAGLIGVAALIDPAHDDVRAWFVAGLVLSLVGDVLLLDDRRFVPGLVAFLAGHLAYVIGFVTHPDWRWWAVGLAAIVVVLLVATAGRRIVAGARGIAPALGGAVVGYLVVISTMALAAAGAGNGWAVAGAALFVTSDALLGWRRFVHEKPWMGPAVMVTYHLGQAGLVAFLV